MLGLGATCGACIPEPPGCCPDTPVVDGKLDMCQNGHTINVSVNACEGILNSGGVCGPCPEEAKVEETVSPTAAKIIKKAPVVVSE